MEKKNVSTGVLEDYKRTGVRCIAMIVSPWKATTFTGKDGVKPWTADHQDPLLTAPERHLPASQPLRVAASSVAGSCENLGERADNTHYTTKVRNRHSGGEWTKQNKSRMIHSILFASFQLLWIANLMLCIHLSWNETRITTSTTSQTVNNTTVVSERLTEGYQKFPHAETLASWVDMRSHDQQQAEEAAEDTSQSPWLFHSVQWWEC